MGPAMEQAEVTARARAQRWDPAKQSQGRARDPLGLESGEGAEARRDAEPIGSGREQASPGEICAMRGRFQVEARWGRPHLSTFSSV